MAMTPVGQFKVGCSGQLAPNVAAKVSATDDVQLINLYGKFLGWLSSIVVRSRTSESEVAGSSPTRIAAVITLT